MNMQEISKPEDLEINRYYWCSENKEYSLFFTTHGQADGDYIICLEQVGTGVIYVFEELEKVFLLPE